MTGIDARGAEGPDRHIIPLLQNPGQQMLRADGPLAAAQSFLHRQFHTAPRSRRQPLGGIGAWQPCPHVLSNGLRKTLVCCARAGKHPMGHSFFLPQKPQQQVLRSYIGMAQFPRRLLGKTNGRFGSG